MDRAKLVAISEDLLRQHRLESKKKYERLASPEEMATHKRLIDGCDQYPFGIDDEPQIVPESTQSKAIAASSDGPE